MEVKQSLGAKAEIKKDWSGELFDLQANLQVADKRELDQQRQIERQKQKEAFEAIRATRR